VAGLEPPDVLVLGGGGILGEAWMLAVLAGLQEASGFDPRGCDSFVGTSAGSIVAAVLVAGVEPRARLGELPEQQADLDDEPPGDGAPASAARGLQVALAAAGRGAAAPLAALGLRSATPGGALVRRAVLRLVPDGSRSLENFGARLERAGARWDGRLAVSAVDLGSGRRVMFGTPGAPEAPVGRAVEASCAIPGVFRPVEIGGRSYVDGGAWSPTNMDTVQASRGTAVLCLNPTGSMLSPLPRLYGAMALVSRSMAAVEALALERRGARVTTVAPDAASLDAIGGNLMNPRPRAEVIAAGLAQGRALRLSA
jgi:NTE family protein